MKSYRRHIIYLSAILSLFAFSCKKYLDVGPPKSGAIIGEVVFGSDLTANAAMRGIYIRLVDITSFAGGEKNSVTAMAGLSADELKYTFTGGSGVPFREFEASDITENNQQNLKIWASAYNVIYQCNALIEGLERSVGVTTTAKEQLQGEAYFVRALCHFYLVNLYGDVPLIITSAYTSNNNISRTPITEVYQQIIDDLSEAQTLLTDSYVTAGRVRPNKFTALALLARAYLYIGDWAKAESMSSLVINSPSYNLEADLNSVFKNTSREAIWQLMPNTPGKNTNEATIFILWAAPTFSSLPFSLTNHLMSAFKTGDLRRTKWVDSLTVGSTKYYYANKYKIGYVATTTPITEYSMVFRLAEQVLIRAEARAQLNKILESQTDLNTIRNRAGLSNTNANDKNSLLAAIEHERQVELFTEWGHRWLDLKRYNRATAVLGLIKPNWLPSDQLYPLPLSEMQLNSNLTPQNPGY